MRLKILNFIYSLCHSLNCILSLVAPDLPFKLVRINSSAKIVQPGYLGTISVSVSELPKKSGR